MHNYWRSGRGRIAGIMQSLYWTAFILLFLMEGVYAQQEVREITHRQFTVVESPRFDEMEIILVQPSEKLFKRWSFTLSAGIVWSGPATDVEKAMITSGFNKKNSVIFFGSSHGHPHSDKTNAGWIAELTYYIDRVYAVGLNYSSISLPGSKGFHETARYLFVEHSSHTMAPIFSAGYYDLLRVGIGPSLYITKAENQSGGDISEESDHIKLGFTFDVKLKVPRRSLLYVALHYRFNRVGNTPIGPFEVEFIDNQAIFPKTTVNYDHSILGFGVGIRF